jgi:hypothetical protein
MPGHPRLLIGIKPSNGSMGLCREKRFR